MLLYNEGCINHDHKSLFPLIGQLSSIAITKLSQTFCMQIVYQENDYFEYYHCKGLENMHKASCTFDSIKIKKSKQHFTHMKNYLLENNTCMSWLG